MLRPLLRNDLQRCTKQGINGGAGSCNPCLRRFAGRQHIKEPPDRLQALAEALNLTPTAQTFTEALTLVDLPDPHGPVTQSTPPLHMFSSSTLDKRQSSRAQACEAASSRTAGKSVVSPGLTFPSHFHAGGISDSTPIASSTRSTPRAMQSGSIAMRLKPAAYLFVQLQV